MKSHGELILKFEVIDLKSYSRLFHLISISQRPNFERPYVQREYSHDFLSRLASGTIVNK